MRRTHRGAKQRLTSRDGQRHRQIRAIGNAVALAIVLTLVIAASSARARGLIASVPQRDGATATMARPVGGHKAGKKKTAPRTADGRPELDGVWDFATATPLERPTEFAGRPVLTDQEAEAYVKTLANDGCRIIKCDGGQQGRLDSAYGAEWWGWRTKLAWNRTSLVVDPPDGRIPPLTPEAQAQGQNRSRGRRILNGPEDFSVADRCLVGFNSGPPMNPGAYNNFMQLFQTRDHVVLLNEMIHNSRIIPLDQRPHLPANIRQWVGDSRGRWDGDTLVVETTNFRADSNPRSGIADHSRLTERFTRVDADTLLYEYTMDDPRRWTQPWTVQIPMAKAPDGTRVYEYACHEGNYAMANSLNASRDEERKEQSQAPDAPPR
jgi:hypothetical protein